MHYRQAAKFVTETGQPAIFGIVEISRKWYDALPTDLQQIVDQRAAASAPCGPGSSNVDADD